MIFRSVSKEHNLETQETLAYRGFRVIAESKSRNNLVQHFA
jgi:hypothetical protein